MNSKVEHQCLQDEMRIVIRVNESRQYEVDLNLVPKREVVYHWKSKYFRTEVEKKLQVKFIYMGKILQDQQLISELNLKNAQIIQAHIVEDQEVVEQPALEVQQINHIQINVDQALQEIVNDQYLGTYCEMLVATFIGFVFVMFALLGLCIFPCSIRAKQGVMLGFVIRLLYVQIQLLQLQTQEEQ